MEQLSLLECCHEIQLLHFSQIIFNKGDKCTTLKEVLLNVLYLVLDKNYGKRGDDVLKKDQNVILFLVFFSRYIVAFCPFLLPFALLLVACGQWAIGKGKWKGQLIQ